MVSAELGSTKPQPVLPFWVEAASALQMPWPLALISAQQAERQSASETQPPVVNCWALPLPTSLAPALLGARASAEDTATIVVIMCCRIELEWVGVVINYLVGRYISKVLKWRKGYVGDFTMEVGESRTYKPGQRSK